MPYVLKFNEKAIADRMENLARYLNLDCTVLEWVLSLREQLAFQTPRRRWIYRRPHCHTRSRFSERPTAGTNPTLLSEADYQTLFRNAWSGQQDEHSPSGIDTLVRSTSSANL